MATLLFQCQECGFGHHEVGHLVGETEIHCIVCQEEHGRLIRVHCWEDMNPIRPACAKVWLLPEPPRWL